jgi:hypothetical protein
MVFEPRDRVVHKSDKRDREMVIVAIAKKEMSPTNFHSEMVNTGQVEDGNFFAYGFLAKTRGKATSLKLNLNC